MFPGFADVQALKKKCKEQINAGKITAPIEHYHCSDYCKKHKQIGDIDAEDQVHQQSKKHKSMDTTKSNDDAPSRKSAASTNPDFGCSKQEQAVANTLKLVVSCSAIASSSIIAQEHNNAVATCSKI